MNKAIKTIFVILFIIKHFMETGCSHTPNTQLKEKNQVMQTPVNTLEMTVPTQELILSSSIIIGCKVTKNEENSQIF